GDRPLCDDVADVRCGTPSIAAATVVPDRGALGAELDTRLSGARAALRARQSASASRLESVSQRMALVQPARLVDVSAARLAALPWRAPMARRVEMAAAQLDARDRQLDALDPRRVLERGFAV